MTMSRSQLEDFYNLAERFVVSVETMVGRATEKDQLRRRVAAQDKEISKMENKIIELLHREEK